MVKTEIRIQTNNPYKRNSIPFKKNWKTPHKKTHKPNIQPQHPKQPFINTKPNTFTHVNISTKAQQTNP